MSEENTERILAEIAEHARLTRQWVGWMVLLVLLLIVMVGAWLLGFVTVEFEPTGF